VIRAAPAARGSERDIGVVIGPSAPDMASGSRRLGRGMGAAIWRRMRHAILVLVLLAAATATARADEPMWSGPPGAAPYPAPPTPTREVSYGHQTLIADGVAIALVTAGFLQDNPYSGLALVGVGANVYALGAPIVHFSNREVGNGFKSLGVRFGLPMLGMLIGEQLGSQVAIACKVGEDCPDPGSTGLAIGAGLGALVAVAIDARFLARKRVTEAPPQIAPTIGYDRSGFTLGVVGSF
jgi:hypothetical protein